MHFLMHRHIKPLPKNAIRKEIYIKVCRRELLAGILSNVGQGKRELAKRGNKDIEIYNKSELKLRI